MAKYPTEIRHGQAGYRGRTGLSNVRPSPRPQGGPRFPVPVTLNGRPVPPPTFPANDPRPGYVTARPGAAGAGFASRANIYIGGFMLGWYLGTLIWGDPFATGGDPWNGTDPIPAHPGWNWFPCATYDGVGGNLIYIGGSHWAGCPGVGAGQQGPDPAFVGAHPYFTTPQQSVDSETALGHMASVIWVADNTDWQTFRESRTVGGLSRGFGASDLSAFEGSPSLLPGYGKPWSYPMKRPEEAPIMWPGQPVAAPYSASLPDPGMQPSENPLTRPAPRRISVEVPPFVSPWTPPVVVVPPVVSPQPGTSPVPTVPPTVILTPNPDGGLDIVTTPGGRTPSPPGKRTIEKKARVSGGPKSLRVVVNWVTEGLDFVDSLYAATRNEKERKCPPRDYKCKFATIFQGVQDRRFDMAKFLESFLNNQLEDYMFGRLGQALGGVSRELGITTGLSRALTSHQGAIGDLTQGGLGDALPELDYDPATQEWALNWDLFGVSIDMGRGPGG